MTASAHATIRRAAPRRGRLARLCPHPLPLLPNGRRGARATSARRRQGADAPPPLGCGPSGGGAVPTHGIVSPWTSTPRSGALRRTCPSKSMAEKRLNRAGSKASATLHVGAERFGFIRQIRYLHRVRLADLNLMLLYWRKLAATGVLVAKFTFSGTSPALILMSAAHVNGVRIGNTVCWCTGLLSLAIPCPFASSKVNNAPTAAPIIVPINLK